MIVMGGSLGGMKAVRTILQGLPASFAEPIAVVLHRQKESDDTLLEVLRVRSGPIIDEVMDKELIRPGHVWIAPADYHLLVDDGHLSLSIDEMVNYARPSIDVLFESAADAYGTELIGVVLTGANYDGARGAAAIEQQGGTVVIEDPGTAECGIMPKAALDATTKAQVRSLEKIAPLLLELSASFHRRQP